MLTFTSSVYHPIPQGSSIFVKKPYRKARTHSQEVEWWRTFMVECVQIFKLYQLQFLVLRKLIIILFIIRPLTNLTIMVDVKVSKIRTHSS